MIAKCPKLVRQTGPAAHHVPRHLHQPHQDLIPDPDLYPQQRTPPPPPSANASSFAKPAIYLHYPQTSSPHMHTYPAGHTSGGLHAWRGQSDPSAVSQSVCTSIIHPDWWSSQHCRTIGRPIMILQCDVYVKWFRPWVSFIPTSIEFSSPRG